MIFEKCIDYIEQNLKNEISIKSLANYLGYSLFHFCRVFHLYKDMTPMEYILRRRLQLSILDIRNGRKMIDIAMDYHFETSSGYSKAFKKYFNNAPSYFRNAMNHTSELSYKEVMEEPCRIEIKEIDSFTVCGLCKEMDFNSTACSWQMSALWDSFDDDNIEEKLYRDINPLKHGEIGICIKEDNDNSKFSYLLGVLAPPGDRNVNWSYYHIPGGKYAVFTTPPVNTQEDDKRLAVTVRNVWRYIFDEWFISNDYEYDEERLDFEFYDERCHYLCDSVMEIYIPIK